MSQPPASALPLKNTMNFEYGIASLLAEGVWRLVANNPSPFTFKGTNTYLIGDANGVVVIDPGPDDTDHLDAILSATPGPITDILITHTHRDHVDGLSALCAATGARTAGYGPTTRTRGDAETGPTGNAFVDQNFQPDRPLRDGDTVTIGDRTLTAHFTPGHAPDHLCFALDDVGIVFSGDHVMGWNTSVIAPPEGHMGDYFASLEKLIARPDDTLYLPGHGGRIESPHRVARAYLVHRKMREAAILDAVRGGLETVPALTEKVYPGIAAALVPAARLSLYAHLELLTELGAVQPEGPLAMDARFAARG